MKRMILAAVLLAFALPVEAKEVRGNVTASLLDQLDCARRPEPTAALIALAKDRLIDPKHNLAVDSLSCFRVKTGTTIARLPFDGICAFVEDPLVHELFPQFYYRGPGTSPGQTVAVLTRAPEADIRAWLKAAPGGDLTDRADIRPDGDIEGLTSIVCSDGILKPR